MPLAAIATGTVDFVLPVAEMPQRLLDLWSNARQTRLPHMERADCLAVAPATQDTKKEKEAGEVLQDLSCCCVPTPDIIFGVTSAQRYCAALSGGYGYMFIREVRKQPKFARLPAIAVSGLARQADIERAREAGFSAHLSKPVSLLKLIKTIEEWRDT